MKSKIRYLIACAAASAIGLAPLAASSDEAKTLASNDEKSAPDTSQQNKMKTCNFEAGKKELKGEERRAFMSDCLKKK